MSIRGYNTFGLSREFPSVFYVLSLCSQGFSIAFNCSICGVMVIEVLGDGKGIYDTYISVSLLLFYDLRLC